MLSLGTEAGQFEPSRGMKTHDFCFLHAVELRQKTRAETFNLATGISVALPRNACVSRLQRETDPPRLLYLRFT